MFDANGNMTIEKPCFKSGDSIRINDVLACFMNYVGDTKAMIMIGNDYSVISISAIVLAHKKRWKNAGSAKKRKIKESLLASQGCCCAKCNEKKDADSLEMHHVIPLSKGGAVFDKSNIELVCHTCHKHHHLMEYYGVDNWEDAKKVRAERRKNKKKRQKARRIVRWNLKQMLVPKED